MIIHNFFKKLFFLTEKSLNVIGKNITDFIRNPVPCFVNYFVECLASSYIKQQRRRESQINIFNDMPYNS